MRTFYRLATFGLLMLFLGPGWSGVAVSQIKQTQMERFLAPFDSEAYLGVCLEEITDRVAKEKKLPAPEGALVTCVQKDSPAAKAGLKEGDVIIGWNQLEIYSAMQLSRIVHETPPGRTVRLRIVRDGKQRKLQVKLDQRSLKKKVWFDDDWKSTVMERLKEKGEVVEEVRKSQERMEELRRQLREQAEKLKELAEKLKEEMHALKPQLKPFSTAFPRRLGIRTIALTEQLAAYFGVPGRKGILIIEVEKDTPAERAGLRAGDVITEVNHRKVDSPIDLMLELMRRDTATVRLTIIRDQKVREITVKFETSVEKEA